MLEFCLIITVIAILAIPILAIASFIGNGNRRVEIEECKSKAAREDEEEQVFADQRYKDLAARVFHD